MRRVKMTKATQPGLGACLALLLLCGRWTSADDLSYRQSVNKWRQDYERYLKADDGFLAVCGLFWLHEGDNWFGSDSLSDIILPAASAPARAEHFRYESGRVTVHLSPGVQANLRGKSIQIAELHPYVRPHQNAGVQATANATASTARQSQPDSNDERVVMGELTLYVHPSGGRLAIRVKGQEESASEEFRGIKLVSSG